VHGEIDRKTIGSTALGRPMMDIVMLVITLTFFGVSVAYVYACDLL
jgi:hypothetical protein